LAFGRYIGRLGRKSEGLARLPAAPIPEKFSKIGLSVIVITPL
jgi:hypothetical protein